MKIKRSRTGSIFLQPILHSCPVVGLSAGQLGGSLLKATQPTPNLPLAGRPSLPRLRAPVAAASALQRFRWCAARASSAERPLALARAAPARAAARGAAPRTAACAPAQRKWEVPLHLKTNGSILSASWPRKGLRRTKSAMLGETAPPARHKRRRALTRRHPHAGVPTHRARRARVHRRRH